LIQGDASGSYFKGTIGIRSSISDGGSGLSHCMYASYDSEASITSIQFRVDDNLDTTGTSSSSNFVYDATAPTTTATTTSPPGGASYTCGEEADDDVRVVLSCDDDGGSGCHTDSPKYCIDTDNTCTPETSYTEVLDISDEGTSYVRYFSTDNLSNDETVKSCEVIIKTEIKLTGYAWSENVGWISFSCENDDSCEEVEYGVEINGSNIEGYAWNEQLGWLKLDPEPDVVSEEYPEAPQHSVKIDTDGETCGEAGRVCGWARFCAGTVNNDCNSATSEEWDGWVKFGPIDGDYVEFDEDTGKMSGWAWGSENVGWISMSCETDESCAQHFYNVMDITKMKAKESAPASGPTMDSNTTTSITLDTISNGQYRIVGGLWQDSLEFTGLDAATSYSFEQRYKETETHYASPASESAEFETEEDCSTMDIGDECGGGVVAYLDGDGGGLIAPAADNSTGMEWGCEGTSVGASGTAIGTGASNTSAILSGCATRPIAASVCSTYDGGDYEDWFLPSLDELYELYINRVAIGGFGSAYYWSSTEYHSARAWLQGFGNGTQYYYYKSYPTRVRCVRAF